MIKSQIKRSAGNKLYSVVGWFCYIACTIISAILNIYLLSKLDQSWAWFLLTMSLALEFGKAYILIRANTYRSLSEYLKNCKFNSSKVSKREFTFYGIYVMFAILSITASLSFSLTITDNTEQTFVLNKQKLEQNIETLENSILKRDTLKKEYDFIKNNKSKNLELARENKYSAEDKWDLADRATDLLASKIAKEKNISINEAWKTVEYKTSKEKIDFEQAKRDLERSKEKLLAAESGEDLQIAKEAYELAKIEVEENTNSFGTINDMKLELNTLKEQERKLAGSSKCFILLAETFGIPNKVKQIKFFILLFVSLLVELCIWLSSPDLRLDGDLLYSYRNDLGLSTKKDVDKLLKEIKDTNTRFSFKEEKKPEVKIVERVPQKTLKEIDNLKEQVELLSREKEEMVASSNDIKNKYEDQIEVLKNKLNTAEDNNDLLETKNTEIENLKENIKELVALVSEKIDQIDKLQLELKKSAEAANLNNGKTDQINKQIETIKELEKKLSEKIKLVEGLKKDVDYFEKANGSLDKDLKSCKSLLNEDAKIIESLNKKISENEKYKYTQEDVKKVIKETAAKGKEEIKNLTLAIDSWKKKSQRLSEENNNLVLANKSLERKLADNEVIKTAEEELEEMIYKK